MVTSLEHLRSSHTKYRTLPIMDVVKIGLRDEVATPEWLVNDILDTFPLEFWTDPQNIVFDPVCKTGMFIRCAAQRFDRGLREQIPDNMVRRRHILGNQIYGLPINTICGLIARRTVYGSKWVKLPEGFEWLEKDYKVLPWAHLLRGLDEYAGNIPDFGYTEFGFEGYGTELKVIEGELKMQLDEALRKGGKLAIVGNPPYQKECKGTSATQIYPAIVQGLLETYEPDYAAFIIPMRWMAGGKNGTSFRAFMRDNQDKVARVREYKDSSEIWSNISCGSILWFRWEKDNDAGTTWDDGVTKTVRKLFEDGHKLAIKDLKGGGILKAVGTHETLRSRVSGQNPFKINSNYSAVASGVPTYFRGRKLLYANPADVKDKKGYLGKWKVLGSKAGEASGKIKYCIPPNFLFIAEPGQACTQTYLVLGAFGTKQEAEYYMSYLRTKIVRYLVSLAVVSQDMNRPVYAFVPELGTYDRTYTDDYLKTLWGISDDQWKHIDSVIKSYPSVVTGAKDDEDDEDDEDEDDG